MDLDEILERIEALQEEHGLTAEDEAELEALKIEGTAAERLMGID
jgi:ribosome assembly protein YihI (activator of Der GTPase)